MGFDLFMGGLAVVVAALVTWLIILYFRSSTSAESSAEIALHGLQNPNSSSDDSSKRSSTNHVGNTTGDKGLNGQIPQAQTQRTGRIDEMGEPNQTEQTETQISRISRMLVLAIVLTTIVFIPSLLSRFSTSVESLWLINPWLQAILTTPTMFWCGAPIHREGWHALQRRTPDVNSLISLGATGAFIYSLAICVAGSQFPEGSRHVYFGGVNVIITLALAIELVELLILRDVEKSQNLVATSQARTTATKIRSSDERSSPSPQDLDAGNDAIGANATATTQSIADRAFDTLIAGIRKLAHFTRIFVITVIIIAVWAFALLAVFGPQPRLTFALFGGVGVLVIAGFILAILALVLTVNGRRKAQHGNIN